MNGVISDHRMRSENKQGKNIVRATGVVTPIAMRHESQAQR